jgi:hypothetical protein
MDTAKSDTTRTARSGCLERTFEDSNCTQIEIDIRCAILNSNVTNSNIPDASASTAVLAAVSTFSMDRTFAISRLTALNDDGIAARTTDSASTMAMSSSSESCASFAASRSSVAIPNDTENARSEPRDPRAPAVLIIPPTVPPFQNVLSSHELRLFSNEGDTLPRVLACQTATCLSIRRLLIGHTSESTTPGKGGKAKGRVRFGSTHHHHYTGCIFGCLLGNVVEFAKCNGSIRTSDAMVHLRKCLEPCGSDAMSCSGSDAVHLQNGFACYNVIRGQLLLLRESKTSPRIDAKYGRKNVALGISTTIFFIFSLYQRMTSDATSLRMATDYFMDRCYRMLLNWRHLHGNSPSSHMTALEAEKRALRRGLIAIRVAKKVAFEKGLDNYNGLRVEIEFMRKGMWPYGRDVSESTQADLCAWIHTDDFINASMPETTQHPVPIDATLPIPLSLCGDIQSQKRNMEDDSSVEGSMSMTSSYPSTLSSNCDAVDDTGVSFTFANVDIVF